MNLRNFIRSLKTPDKYLSMYVSKSNGKLIFDRIRDYECRLQNTENMIRRADTLASFRDFKKVIISVDDKYIPYRGDHAFLSVACKPGFYDYSVPDFMFESWPETGLLSYQDTIARSQLLPQPNNQILGWRGAITNQSRRNLVDISRQLEDVDIEEINWDRSDPRNLKASNFLSFEDQLIRWRYFIDLEGRGYSARLKLYLASLRLVFVQERDYHEFFWKSMEPFKHFIPIRNDLSDLPQKLSYVRKNPNIETAIVTNLIAFRENYLTYNSAIQRWIDVLSSL